jgi:hypothetical protein
MKRTTLSAAAPSAIVPARLALALGILCLAFSAAAGAAGQKACAGDVAQFCKGVERGGGRIARCLNQHQDELSPACKARLDAAKEEGREVAEACKEDAQKHCQDVKRGGGRIMQCLRNHQGELSNKCQDKLDQARDMAKHG